MKCLIMQNKLKKDEDDAWSIYSVFEADILISETEDYQQGDKNVKLFWSVSRL